MGIGYPHLLSLSRAIARQVFVMQFCCDLNVDFYESQLRMVLSKRRRAQKGDGGFTKQDCAAIRRNAGWGSPRRSSSADSRAQAAGADSWREDRPAFWHACRTTRGTGAAPREMCSRPKGFAGAALNHYLAAVELQPQAAEHHGRAGFGFWYRGDNERACQYFRRAIDLNPSYPEAHEALAQIYKETGQLRSCCWQRAPGG